MNFAPMNVGPMGEGRGRGNTFTSPRETKSLGVVCCWWWAFCGSEKKETPGGYGKGKRKKVLLADRPRHLSTVSGTT